MKNSLIGRETNLRASRDSEGLFCSRGVDIAADRLESDILNWTVVVNWSPLANVLELAGSLAVDVQSSETIVSESLGGKAENAEGGSGNLHFERE